VSKQLRNTIDSVANNLTNTILRDETKLFNYMMSKWDEYSILGYEKRLRAITKAGELYTSNLGPEIQKSFVQIADRMQKWDELTPEMLEAVSHISQSKIMKIGKGLTNKWNDTILHGIMMGKDEGALRKMLKESTDALDHHIRTEVNTALNTYSRSVNLHMAKNAPLKKLYRYEGPVDGKTRPVCLDMVGAGDLKLSDIDEQFPGAMLDGGGYNCRHQWIPVDIAEPSLKDKANKLQPPELPKPEVIRPTRGLYS